VLCTLPLFRLSFVLCTLSCQFLLLRSQDRVHNTKEKRNKGRVHNTKTIHVREYRRSKNWQDRVHNTKDKRNKGRVYNTKTINLSCQFLLLRYSLTCIVFVLCTLPLFRLSFVLCTLSCQFLLLRYSLTCIVFVLCTQHEGKTKQRQGTQHEDNTR
jgi:ABC-type siderophore export system fused ATPase/permease subunit